MKSNLTYSLLTKRNLVFYGLLFVVSSPILFNSYFLTGDGPCHLYNARVLVDLWSQSNIEFYSKFYFINPNFEPNWFSHVGLAALLFFLPATVAEKVFLLIYVLIFAFSLKSISNRIKVKNQFLMYLGFPLILVYTLFMGFYNYTFGIAFWLLSLSIWLKVENSISIKGGVYLLFINTLLFFTHPIGWLFSGLTIVTLSINKILVFHSEKPKQKKAMAAFLMYVITCAPSVILFCWFLLRKELNISPNGDSLHHLWHTFLQFTSLVSVSKSTAPLAQTVSIIFFTLLFYGIFLKIRSRKWNENDGFLILFLLSLFIYLNQPGGLAGGGIFSVRMQFIPYIPLLFWLIGLEYPHWVKRVMLITFIVLNMGFTFFNWKPIHGASRAIEEYSELAPLIPSNSVVLALNHNHFGFYPSGEIIGEAIWLFMHSADYLAVENSLIMLPNYEANTGFFPLIWYKKQNPYLSLAKGLGIEGEPPEVDIERYENQSGYPIDYIVLAFDNFKNQDHPVNIDFENQIENKFRLIHITSNSRMKLYERIN